MNNTPLDSRQLKLVEVTDKQTWDQLGHNFWQQTWEYGELQKTQGRSIVRYTITTENPAHTLGYFQLVIYPGMGTHRIGYIPHGPYINATVWKPYMEQELSGAIVKLGRTLSCFFVRVEPELMSHTEGIAIQNLGQPIPLFAYRSSFNQPRGEIVMLLEDDIDMLYGRLSKSTKRNLKKAEQYNLVCTFHYGQEMRDYTDEFIALNKANTQSHGTTTHADSYFHNLFAVLAQNPQNFIARVTDHEGVCAINVFTVWEDNESRHSFCPFGASNERGKQKGAYYFIKWQAIVEMKPRIHSFNWGGVSVGYNDDNLKNLNAFKQGFEKNICNLGPLHDVVISQVWYTLYLARSYLASLTKH